MTMHPYIGSENVRERQREMIAQADRRRLERQLSDLARAARRRRRAGAVGAAPGVVALARLLPRRWAAR